MITVWVMGMLTAGNVQSAVTVICVRCRCWIVRIGIGKILSEYTEITAMLGAAAAGVGVVAEER